MGYYSEMISIDHLELDEAEKFQRVDKLIRRLQEEKLYEIEDPLKLAVALASIREEFRDVEDFIDQINKQLTDPNSDIPWYIGYIVDENGIIDSDGIDNSEYVKRYDQELLEKAIAYSLLPGRYYALLYLGEDEVRYGTIIVKSKSGKVTFLPFDDETLSPKSENKLTREEFDPIGPLDYAISIDFYEEYIDKDKLQHINKVITEIQQTGSSSDLFAEELLKNFTVDEINQYSFIEEIDGEIGNEIPEKDTDIVDNLNVHAFVLAHACTANKTGEIYIKIYEEDSFDPFNKITLAFSKSGKVEKFIAYLTIQYKNKQYIYGSPKANKLINSLLNS